MENLLVAWKEFIKGKRKKKDVQEFQLNLMGNIIDLHNDLKNFQYIHGPYQAFNINDPKPRNIHKASVRDRLLHHAVYRALYPFFDRTFIADSFSCRLNKGTHKAINRFRNFSYKVSKNNTRTVWVLKCDIKKFFASVEHGILLTILKKYIPDNKIIWLLSDIIDSFHTTESSLGLPLGNLTSQLLVNIYMNEFDQFVKHQLKAEHYLRYADDFVILSDDKTWLNNLMICDIARFLEKQLGLQLHQGKVSIRTLASGIDFLGWVNFPDYRVFRTVTKRRMLRRIKEDIRPEIIQSYFGLLRHGNTKKLIGLIERKKQRCYNTVNGSDQNSQYL